MASLTDEDRNALLRLARSIVTARLVEGHAVEYPSAPGKALAEKRGCFVTLHIKGALRGCIGTIEPIKPLVESVEENAVNAAFKDPRFPPLKKHELEDVDFEISVLTVPRYLDHTDARDLKRKLKKGIHGVILSKGWHRSTFLPQVWDQLPETETFLEHLCQKGGMKKDCWKDTETLVQVYEAEYFSE